ncbi:FtsX-like permease family protein [uncultured Bartonella sp.]|uniref:ABC transporter permease n=1 Tax=uncultured Bartonella sp. TaxID=104108 RepID=UPI00260E90C0|nr:FtsX-like permease family protein [uncultured Bartonella sp.]
MTWLHELFLAWRFALREMRGGLKGFYIFIALIALGVAAIGAVDNVSRNISHELQNQGRTILAGDMRFSQTQRPANETEMAFFQKNGKVCETILMRSMARRVDSDDSTLVEIKAVDKYYPFYGELKTTPPNRLEKLFEKEDGQEYGVVAQKLLLDRLQLHVGDKIKVGNIKLSIRAVVDEEPDLLSEGFQLGPRLFMSTEALKTTGLLEPGSLRNFVYKIAFAISSDDHLQRLKQQSEKQFSNSEWSIRTRLDATPVLAKNLERFTSFLTLIGLTALIVGGVGVANSVATYMDEKRNVIAIFKALGASSRMIMEIYFSQIMLIALIGIAIGLCFAIVTPFVASLIVSHYLPFFTHARIYPVSLLLALVFAVLTTAAFAFIPLSRARYISVTTLLRPFVASYKINHEKSSLVIVAILFITIVLLAVWSASDHRMAALFLVAVTAVFVVLRLLAALISSVARKCAHARSPVLRLAITNIYRPGSITPSVVLALGLGLTLLVTLSSIDSNLRAVLTDSVPEKTPDFFFMDIRKSDAENFSRFLKDKDPQGLLKIMPTLRARITKLNNVAAKDVKVSENSEWVLRGDRNITYSEKMPENTVLSEGKWWNGQDGNNSEISFSQREARGLHLKLGDTVTVNILGHEITSRVTSLRDVDWDSFNMNFVMIFSPNTLKNAPHVFLATFKSGNDTFVDEAQIMRDIAHNFPSITIVPVHQLLGDARKIVGEIGMAIRVSSFIAILAAILVLIGTLSASNRARIHDAVILKTLGATRKMLLKAYLYEYAIIGCVTAIFASLAGELAGSLIARYQMDIDNIHITAGTGFVVIVAALILTIGFGLLGTWHILGEKPSRFLREL